MSLYSAKQGSITVYLCLILAVILSLITVSFYSVCFAAGRVALASGMEQGLYSLFAGYDRELFDAYGLLFLDGGYGTGDLKLEGMCNEVQEAASYVVDPQALLGICLEEGTIEGYVLATDNQGAAFRKQICTLMEKKLGAAGVQVLSEKMQDQFGVMEEQKEKKDRLDTKNAERDYEKKKEIAKTENMQLREKEYKKQIEVPPDFENPIEVIQKIRKMGILGLVVSEVSNLSNYALSDESLINERELQQGMGLLPEAASGTKEKFLLLEYLSEMFPCYASTGQGQGLKYQMEYVVGGKKSDMENLKSVVYQLLAVREASNLIYLCTDAVRCAEADEMAITISTMLLMPEAYSLVSFVLKICWAFGESILDIRELLEGGEIPLLKDDTSWQLSLNSLSKLLEWGDEERHSSEGMNYQQYLTMLLMVKKEETLARSLMTLIEHNMRLLGGNPRFCMDSYIEAVEVTLFARIRDRKYSITRSYGYDMDI